MHCWPAQVPRCHDVAIASICIACRTCAGEGGGGAPGGAGRLTQHNVHSENSVGVSQDPAREKEVTALLGELGTNDFDRLVALGKRMTDYTAESAIPEESVRMNFHCC